MDGAPYRPVRLMYVLNTETAPVTESTPFNPVRLVVGKIRYCLKNTTRDFPKHKNV